MKSWPIKKGMQELPITPEPGSFWEDRGDRFHCGIDLYVAEGSDVVSIEQGWVVDVGIATTPKKIPYWNETYYVIIKNESGNFCKYAELGEVKTTRGEYMSHGELIGKVGLVLNGDKIDDNSPRYIQLLKNKNPSMLHLELYNENPITAHDHYLGGNWFTKRKPENLLDPTSYLRSILDATKAP